MKTVAPLIYPSTAFPPIESTASLTPQPTNSVLATTDNDIFLTFLTPCHNDYYIISLL